MSITKYIFLHYDKDSDFSPYTLSGIIMEDKVLSPQRTVLYTSPSVISMLGFMSLVGIDLKRVFIDKVVLRDMKAFITSAVSERELYSVDIPDIRLFLKKFKLTHKMLEDLAHAD